MQDAPSHYSASANRAAEKPSYTTEQSAQIEETREWLAEAAALVEEDIREQKPDAENEMRTIWNGMDDWKLAAVIEAGDLHRLPEFVARIAARDTRLAVRDALAHDASDLGTTAQLSVRHRTHLRELGISDDQTLREHTRRISVNLFARAKDAIEAGERPPLVPDEIHFAAFLASRIPTPEAVQTLLCFARTSPEVAEALVQNDILRNLPSNGSAAAERFELIQRVFKDLVDAVKRSNGNQRLWYPFLIRAHAFLAGKPDLKKICDEVEAVMQKDPALIVRLIGNPDIPDPLIQRLVSIKLIRSKANDPAWRGVFQALHRHRYDLFSGVIKRELRQQGDNWMQRFLDRPFGASF